MSLRRWRPLIPILILALLMRVGYMSSIGFSIDLQFNSEWALRVYQGGLFNLYKTAPPDYPPLYMAALGVVAAVEYPRSANFDSGSNPELIALLKVFPVLADLALIAVVYAWLQSDEPRNRFLTIPLTIPLSILLPALLAIYPGLFALSAFWGQSDSLLTLLVVLVLVALNRNRPLVAWVFFAIAILTKFQALVVLPLLVVLTFRRYGIRRLVLCGGVSVVLTAAVLAPFIATSGLQNALRPYIGTVDTYPLLTSGAYNPWLLVSQMQGAQRVLDNTWVIGQVTPKHIGLALLGLYTLIICAAMVRREAAQAKPMCGREFVWAAALTFGFFMLPTQIHERYICMAAILSLIAVAQDRRMWWIAAGLALTFSFNILNTLDEPLRWLGLVFWPRTTTAPIAVINCALFVELTILAGWPAFSATFRRAVPLIKVSRIVAALVLLAMVFGLEIESKQYNQTAIWLEQHVADWEHLVYDHFAQEVATRTNVDLPDDHWSWHVEHAVEKKSPIDWLNDGNHYLVVDERTDDSTPFAQRIKHLTDQGATLLYETANPLNIGAKQAVLWTFSPTYPLRYTFDGTLELIGYQPFATATGKPAVLFLWYNRQPTTVVYNVFMHVLDSAGIEQSAQADAQVGAQAHPTNTWRTNELVFDIVPLPDNVMSGGQPLQIRVGLYQLSTGERAAIADSQGKTLGGSIVIHVP